MSELKENIKYPLREALLDFKKMEIKIPKNCYNLFHKNNYSNIDDILNAVEVKLAELGVLITSCLGVDPAGGRAVVTKLWCADSEEVEQSNFPIQGTKPQEYGVWIAYGRRYNMTSLLNLSSEDNDGDIDALKTEPKSNFTTNKERSTLFNAIKYDVGAAKNLEDLSVAWVSRTPELGRFKEHEPKMFEELEAAKDEKKKSFIDAKVSK